jgi:hypothetical protein
LLDAYVNAATGKVADICGKMGDFLSESILIFFDENIIKLFFPRGYGSGGEKGKEPVIWLQFARNDVGKLFFPFSVLPEQLNIVQYIHKLVVSG